MLERSAHAAGPEATHGARDRGGRAGSLVRSPRVRLALAALIAAVPLAGLRRVLLNALLGARIDRTARIGIGTVVAVRSFEVGPETVIGAFNVFRGPIDVTIGTRAKIGRANTFKAPWHVVEERFRSWGYAPRFVMGDETLVLGKHFFDLFGTIEIGAGTWIAGYGSQFWTHGLSVMDRNIEIGSGNYVGSAVKVSPGVRVGDRNIVALGSVLFGKLDVSEHLISGVPAKPLRSVADDMASGRYAFTFADW